MVPRDDISSFSIMKIIGGRDFFILSAWMIIYSNWVVPLYATSEGTAAFMKAHSIEVTVLHWPLENKEPNVINHITNKKIDLIINIPKNAQVEELDNDYIIRRKAIDFNISLITNIKFAKRFVEAIKDIKLESLKVKSWDEYKI